VIFLFLRIYNNCLAPPFERWKEKVKDLSVPFGHCYVVGMLLSGMDLNNL